MDSVADIESKLLPSELELVKYHRATIANGLVGRDEAGRPVTVYSNTIEIPEGPHKGKFVTVPGYFDKAIHTDEEQLWKKWGQEINAGKWPIYEDSNFADARAKYLHGIMDIEGDMANPAVQLYGGTP